MLNSNGLRGDRKSHSCKSVSVVDHLAYRSSTWLFHTSSLHQVINDINISSQNELMVILDLEYEQSLTRAIPKY